MSNNKHSEDEYFFEDDQLNDMSPSEQNDFFGENSSQESSASGEDSALFDEYAEDKDTGFVSKAKQFLSDNMRSSITVGVAVIALIVFGIMKDSSKVAISESQKNKSSAAQTAKSQMNPSTAPISRSVAQSSMSMKNTSELNNLRAEQNKASELNKKQIDIIKGLIRSQQTRLDNIMSSLSEQQAQSSQHNALITKQLSELIKQSSFQAREIQALQAYNKAMLVKKKRKAQNYIRYTLRGMDQGRAWILGSNGILQTVVIGAVVPHYGKVLKFNLEQGVLEMSKENIKYKRQSIP